VAAWTRAAEPRWPRSGTANRPRAATTSTSTRSLADLVLLGAALTRRWGRGSYESTFQKPENEIQTTSPWKFW